MQYFWKKLWSLWSEAQQTAEEAGRRKLIQERRERVEAQVASGKQALRKVNIEEEKAVEFEEVDGTLIS